MSEFKDEKVDRMLREKMEYLEQVKREVERAKKLEQKQQQMAAPPKEQPAQVKRLRVVKP
jgi:hypothetical protein